MDRSLNCIGKKPWDPIYVSQTYVFLRNYFFQSKDAAFAILAYIDREHASTEVSIYARAHAPPTITTKKSHAMISRRSNLD